MIDVLSATAHPLINTLSVYGAIIASMIHAITIFSAANGDSTRNEPLYLNSNLPSRMSLSV